MLHLLELMHGKEREMLMSHIVFLVWHLSTVASQRLSSGTENAFFSVYVELFQFHSPFVVRLFCLWWCVWVIFYLATSTASLCRNCLGVFTWEVIPGFLLLSRTGTYCVCAVWLPPNLGPKDTWTISPEAGDPSVALCGSNGGQASPQISFRWSVPIDLRQNPMNIRNDNQ